MDGNGVIRDCTAFLGQCQFAPPLRNKNNLYRP